MDHISTRTAAETLLSSWQTGTRIAALEHSCRPSSRIEGYAVQAALQALTGQALFGWKIAATSAAGQAHIGVDAPLAGRLLADRVRESGATVSLRANQMRVAEPEFAFQMGRDLLPRDRPYTREEVLEAVAALHPAIEVPDSRYSDFARVGAAQLIADNACADYFVLGAPAPIDWRSVDLIDQAVHLEIEGQAVHSGSGANVLGDPQAALTWLANELSELRIGLRAGQVVTTGTCMTPVEVEPGNYLRADFGVIGSVVVHFEG